MLAFAVGCVLLLSYQYLNIISWLSDTNSVLVTMLVTIIPLILITEMLFLGYQYLKSRISNVNE